MWSIAASCCWPYPGAYGAALLLRDLFSPVVFSVDVQVCHVYRLHSSSARQIVLSRLCPISTTTVRPPGAIGRCESGSYCLFTYLFFLSRCFCFPFFFFLLVSQFVFVSSWSNSQWSVYLCLIMNCFAASYTLRVLRWCFNLFFSFFLLFLFSSGSDYDWNVYCVLS